MPRCHSISFFARLLLICSVAIGLAPRVLAVPDLQFDVFTFCCVCSNQMACEGHFERMNFPTTNGHYIAMGSDDHRYELAANGNSLAVYYNNFSADIGSADATNEAATIDSYAIAHCTSTGPRPDWVVLNEISGSMWPTNATYRQWVRDVVHLLRVNYGYTPIVYAPFPTASANNSDWQALAADGYIAIENYLGGEEVAAQNYSVSWCQGKYQSSMTSYTGVGVPSSRLILGEHFGQTLSGSGYGRCAIASNNWDTVIAVRSKALLNVHFPGFIGYSWGGNVMNVSSNEILHFIGTYSTNPLPYVTPITAPSIIIQPQSATLPVGSDVALVVYKSGSAPTTYQWRLNGTNISGANTSAYNLIDITSSNAGTYSVILSNSAGRVFSSNAVLTVKVPDPLVYEPFANATANGGTAYNPGELLTIQTNAQGFSWKPAGTSATGPQPVVSSGSLSIPGLALPSGNSVTYGNTSPSGPASRLTLAQTYTTGSMFYSFALRISSLASLTTSASLLAGFNNSAGTQSGQPTVYAATMYVRLSGSGYNVGLAKAGGTLSWDTSVHPPNETLFVVGEYTFNSATTNDDIVYLWINPPSSNFGTADLPPYTLTTSAGNDISSSQIRSFQLRDAVSTQPIAIVDELRIGTSWASVTPPLVAPTTPVLSIQRIDPSVVLSWPTNATGFTLESSAALPNANSWTAIGSGTIFGNQFVVTNNVSLSNLFYRLRWP